MPGWDEMERLSDVLARSGDMLWFWCPACEEMHSACAKRWHWDGSVDRPTLSPSVLHFIPQPGGGREVLCHYFIKDGQLQYCSDNTHGMNGRTVPLPQLPSWVGRP